MIELDPPKGFAAEASAASVLYVTAFAWQRADLDHTRHYRRHHGDRRHQTAVRRPLGRRRQHHGRLGTHDPGRGRGRGGCVLG